MDILYIDSDAIAGPSGACFVNTDSSKIYL